MYSFYELLSQRLSQEEFQKALAECEKSYFNEEYWKNLLEDNETRRQCVVV